MTKASTGDAFTTALTAELGKKTGVCWLRYAPPTAQPTARSTGQPKPPSTASSTAPALGPVADSQASRTDHPAWHVWLDGALCLVSGGSEQFLPGIEGAGTVEVIMRSKDSGGRLLTWLGEASVVNPEDEHWNATTAALVAGRLNLDDLSTAAATWAQHSVVTRIVPANAWVESPGSISDDSHQAVPRATPATTRGPLPRVLHKRVRRRPKLS